MNTFEWYTPSLGAVVGIALTFAITLVHIWFGPPETIEKVRHARRNRKITR